MTPSLTDLLIRLAGLSLKFGRVERVTFHEDGQRPETDTDHTVMLMLCVVTVHTALAPRLPALDLHKCLLYALVHDLVEAHAGDTPSYRITAADDLAKRRREADAWRQIRDDFGFPATRWLPDTIAAYERQETVEARFVRFLDKMLPKLTHLLNNAETLRRRGETPDGLEQFLEVQYASLVQGSPDLACLGELFEELGEITVARFRDFEEGR